MAPDIESLTSARTAVAELDAKIELVIGNHVVPMLNSLDDWLRNESASLKQLRSTGLYDLERELDLRLVARYVRGIRALSSNSGPQTRLAHL